MIDQTKIEIYREVYKEWKEIEQLEDFRYPKEKEHLDFSCTAGDTLIKFRLFTDKDLLQLRAEQQCADTDDEKNGERIREISQKYNGVFGTAYDGTAILNMSVPLTSVADDAAKKLVASKSNEFAGIVVNEMADLSREYVYMTGDAETIPAEEETDDRNEQGARNVNQQERQVMSLSAAADALADNEELYNANTEESGMMEGSTVVQDTSVQVTHPEADDGPVESSRDPLEDIDFTSDLMDGGSNDSYLSELEGMFEPEPFEDELQEVPDPKISGAESDRGSEEMVKAVHRRVEQQDYREGILQEMRDLVARDKAEAALLKQQAEDAAEKNKKENDRLKESWNKYHKSSKNLDKRMSSVAEREKKAMAKELELTQREDDIKRVEAELKAEKDEYGEKLRELDAEIDRNHSLLKTLETRKENLDDREAAMETREKSLDIRQERIEMDRKTVDESIQDMYAMEKMLKELKGKALPVDTSRYEDQIRKLKADQSRLQEAGKKSLAAAAAFKKQYEQSVEENRELRERLNKLNSLLKESADKQDGGELEKIKSQLSDTRLKMQIAERRADNAEKGLNEMQEKNKELSEKLAASVKEPVLKVLATAGYPASPIVGEGNPLLTFDIDGCTVVVDEQLGMACMEKTVKRNYVKTFDIWNSQSFAETYSMSKGKAYCRFAYENITDDSRRIAAKLNTLK